jgi:Restriction endonuclease
VAKKSDIPFAGDFSPREIDLEAVLSFPAEHPGDRAALQLEIRKRYYERPETPPEQRDRLAYNVSLGMEKYGLIEKDGTLTPLGTELHALAGQPDQMYERFARHILVEMPGALLLDAARDMRAAGEKITLNSLRETLAERGVHTSSANKSMSLMRLWLDAAKVTDSRWQIDESAYSRILGLSETEIEALVELGKEERAILKTLAEIGITVDSSKLRKAAEAAYAVKLNEKAFARTLKPLAEKGLLVFKPAGGKSAPVAPTARLLKDVTIPLIEQYGEGLPPKLRVLLRRPLSEIVEALDSSTHQKGLALEALAFKMMRSIGLEYLETRFRPSSGGRFEVDLLFESKRLGYSRWQIQCKNTGKVSLEDVAKEVGLVYRLLSDTIVVITRGAVGDEARRYAADVMRKTSLSIILIDGQDVAAIISDPLAIYGILEREAAAAAALKPVESA